MEFVDGVSIGDVQKMEEQQIDQKEIARLLTHAFARQMYVEGFVHADPHQGNLFVRKYKGYNQLIIFDHGLYKQLDQDTKLSYGNLWRGILTQDEQLIIQSCKELYKNATNVNYQMLASMVTSKPYEKIMDKT